MSRVEVVATREALAEAAARSALADMAAAVDAYETCTWVLTGGATPQPAYRRLTERDLRDSIEWGRITVAMGDERCVPPDDPESNWGQAAAALLDHVPIPEGQRLRIRGELGAERAADDYQAALARLPRQPRQPRQPRLARNRGQAGAARGGEQGAVEPPRLDLVWIGVGPDGHCLSLFPGFPELDVLDRLVVPVHGAPKPPPDRVSLTLAALGGADRLLVLVSGAEKAEAVARARNGDASLPVTRAVAAVESSGGTVTWLLDRSAAGE